MAMINSKLLVYQRVIDKHTQHFASELLTLQIPGINEVPR